MKKERIDKILVDLGYFENKSKASAAILAGDVRIGDEKITKAGYQLDPSKDYDFIIKTMPYVSRGGFKLQKALDTFNINVTDTICFDAGASTGGFSDCLLQRGASKIYAVDVGYGQLAWKIRNNPLVKTIEKTNLKICTSENIYSENDLWATLLVSDLSFISLERVLPNLKTLMSQNSHQMVCLIKPQFEAGKEFIEKGGVIRNPKTHIMVIENVINCIHGLGYSILGLTYSSIKGPAGNIEYLIYFTTEQISEDYLSSVEVVEEAHNELN